MREREIHEALPKAWTKLVAEENEYLIDAVAECVGDLCGHRPAPDTVARFLRTIQPGSGLLPTPALTTASLTPRRGQKDQGSPKVPVVKPRRKVAPTPTPPSVSEKAADSPPAGIGFTLFGEFVSCQSGREILVNVFEALAEYDSTFLRKFELERHGSRRRWLAKDPNELHPANPRRARDRSYSHQLKSGYWLILQVDHRQRQRIIERACEVAGIGHGTDLRINNPPIKERPGARGRKHA